MQSKVEQAIQNFKKGHNCAQAVVCTYCEDFGMRRENAFRLAEAYGGGITGLQTICGAASGLIMIASLKCCPKMDVENTTKKVTYPCIKNLHEKFKQQMGAIECKDLLANKDHTLIDGKKAGCIDCVRCACQIIEKELYE